jgi:multidrug efflux pump
MSSIRKGLPNLSGPFIRRPAGTTLLTIALVLLGLLAYGRLPVSPLPQVTIPTISVQAALPGAGPQVMAKSVATPLERQLGRIPGITEMTSRSIQGATTVLLQFDLTRDIDGAARDVQAALNAARAQLPSDMPSNPSFRKVNPADTPVVVLALTSAVRPPESIYDYASNVVAQRISQVEGVGQANVAGSSPMAVRVDLNPTALNKYAISMDTVRRALQNNTVDRPLGAVEGDGKYWQLYADGSHFTASHYRGMVIASRNGADVRLSDVAEVTDSVEDTRNMGFLNGKRAVLVFVGKQPDANIIATADRIMAILPRLRASVPADISIDVAMERTSTIRASLLDAEKTLIASTCLVIFVVFVFLHGWRAALVPAVVVPVSLIATFAVMYLCDYSLDTLSLMALTIATGFIVDDTVVVVENISRHIELGMPPARAAMVGASEVGFTVLSMTLSLIAVFIPVLFFPGVVGRYLREFSVTLSIAVSMSLIMSLTTAPMLCAYVLDPIDRHRPAKLRSVFDMMIRQMLRAYAWTLRFALKWPALTLALFALIVGLNVYMYLHIHKGFFPPEDTGRLYSGIDTDQAISFQSYTQKIVEFMRIIKSDPAVDNVAGYAQGTNSGLIFISLKPWEERDIATSELEDRLRPKLDEVADASLWMGAAHDIRIGAKQSNGGYQYTLRGESLQDLREWAPKIESLLESVSELKDVSMDDEVDGMEADLILDRATASRLGVTMGAIDSTLNNAFSQRQVAIIHGPLSQYHVVMGIAPKYLQSPESLRAIYVQAAGGAMVPLSAFSRYETKLAPLSVDHQEQFVASTISFNLPKGVSLEEAREAIERAMGTLNVPKSLHGEFEGDAREAQRTVNILPWLLWGALLSIYIVLGILYESFVHPLTILSTLPAAGAGALIALRLFDLDLTLIAFIGVLLLIGIVNKNAIMMIDVALDAQRRQGMNVIEAVVHACLLRFRPIMMTTLAAMLAALPLALGAGEGREMRQPLGISILGGLLLSQLLTLYSTPVMYLYMDRLRSGWKVILVGSAQRWQSTPPDA